MSRGEDRSLGATTTPTSSGKDGKRAVTTDGGERRRTGAYETKKGESKWRTNREPVASTRRQVEPNDNEGKPTTTMLQPNTTKEEEYDPTQHDEEEEYDPTQHEEREEEECDPTQHEERVEEAACSANPTRRGSGGGVRLNLTQRGGEGGVQHNPTRRRR